MKRTINIVMADDHKLFRDSILALLKNFNINTLGAFNNGLELINSLEILDPDLVILDLEMPVMNGTSAVKIIKEKFPAIKIIILTQHDNPQLAQDYIEKGVNGYLPKNTNIETLVETIKQAVFWNTIYNPYSEKELLLNKKAELSKLKFSKREKEIITLIHEGKSNKEISNDLNIVIKTVEAHKKKIYIKTEAKNLTEFLVKSLKNGLNFLIK